MTHLPRFPSRLQLAGKFVVLATMFGTAIPVLYLIAAIYFWLAAWIDRYNLLRRLAPCPGVVLLRSVRAVLAGAHMRRRRVVHLHLEPCGPHRETPRRARARRGRR